MVGETILHYKILEKLGEGGMGVVYKAEDTKLKRTVALKFLPLQAMAGKEEKARFRHEAQAAASLDHQNICTVYEINEADGQAFIAMAFVEGESLQDVGARGLVPLPDILNYAIQIAEGLQAAHEKNIVHRDIKPANILVTGKGQVRITDFGLAKLANRTMLTKEGITMGTVAYMSPEQTHGSKVDYRTDIWSLGVMLYEMVTGQQPFKGDYEQAVIYSILNEEPDPPASLRDAIPPELEQVIQNALRKDPGERWEDMEAMLSALKSVKKNLEAEDLQAARKGQESAVPSIAVLPFVNMSADPENEYFSDGLAEELINALTKLRRLRVVARTSAFSFKGKQLDVREIGEKLNVDTVLEGSVRKAGNRLRITAQLVEVADGYHLWSERYDREMADIFSIQDEISLAIVERLKVELFGEEKDQLLKRYTDNEAAYTLYMKGRYYLNKRTSQNFHRAIDYFQQAVAMEPGYALAYAGMADAYNLLERYGVVEPEKALPEARAAAQKACEIDDNLAEAYCALAYNKMTYDWDWQGSEKDFRRAIALNPKYATAHHWFAWFLAALGRHDEAMNRIKRALELDPLSLIINTNVGTLFYFEREYDRSIEQLQKILELEPGFVVAHQWLGRSYEQKQLYADAIAEHQKTVKILGDDPESLASLAHAYAISGKKVKAEKIIQQLKKLSGQRFVSQYWMGLIYAGLGELDMSFTCLYKAADERFDWLLFAKVEPMLDPLRSDRRFKALLKKLGLEA